MKSLTLKTFGELLKETYTKWNQDKAPRLGAALAYYTIFSMAPLFLILVAIAGFVLGKDAVQGHLDDQIRGVVGNVAATAIQSIVQSAHHPKTGTVASLIGLATALFGAAGFFGQLQDALNTIWGVMLKPGLGFMAIVKQRFLSFAMVLGAGFLLLVSLVVSAAISTLVHYMDNYLPLPGWSLQLINFVISFVVITLLFAMLYRGLPDVQVAWRDVWIGAAMTSLLFAVGKYALGLYVSHSAGSAITAVGSFMALLVWIYYAAQILLFGAEFTYIYAAKCGSEIMPSPNAVRVTPEQRAQEGIDPHAQEKHEEVRHGQAPPRVTSPFPARPPVTAAVGAHSTQRLRFTKRAYDTTTAALLGFFGVMLVAMRLRRH